MYIVLSLMSLVNKMHMVFLARILSHQCNTVSIIIHLFVINEAGNSHRVVYSFIVCFILCPTEECGAKYLYVHVSELKKK